MGILYTKLFNPMEFSSAVGTADIVARGFIPWK